MLSPWLIILSLVVGHILGHSPSVDPSCLELKTSKRADDCCKIPEAFDEAILRRCFTGLLPTQNDLEKLNCVAECVARELGAMKNGTFDKQAAKLMLMSTFGVDLHFTPIIGGIYDKCYDRVTAITKHGDEKHEKCSFVPAFMLDCVESGLFENCPSVLWDGSDGCVELKGKLIKGCPFIAIAERKH